MLVLSRRVGERLLIGDDIVVTVIEVRGDGVRLGIDAPREVRVHRAEVLEAVRAANIAASVVDDDAAAQLRLLVPPTVVPPTVVPPTVVPPTVETPESLTQGAEPPI